MTGPKERHLGFLRKWSMRMIAAAWEDSSQQPLCILMKEESLSNNQSYNYIIRLREMDFIKHLRERERHSGKIFKVSGPCRLDKT